MRTLAELEPIGRKQWAKRKWDEYQETELAKTIRVSKLVYNEPTNKKMEGVIDKPKWKATVDKKVNYLLGRPPVCEGHQDILDSLDSLLRETAKNIYLAGSAIWIVQGNGVDIDPVPMIMSDTIAVYSDQNRQEVFGYVRKRVEIELEASAGSEETVDYYELYYQDGEGMWHRETFCYSVDGKDTEETFMDGLCIIQLNKTGDAPLFAYIEDLLNAFDHSMKHQDKAVQDNTEPLVEVRGYSGTSDDDLEYAVKTMKIARTDGNGGVTIHTRSMDTNSIDLWQRRLLQEYSEAACIVLKENELQYAQSGKAMDRLFVDMENSARELAQVLEKALKEYFLEIGINGADIVWNTDRPTDDLSIISGITQSQGLLSRKTLIAQHPWVENVEEELKNIEEESVSGMEDLFEPAVEEGV